MNQTCTDLRVQRLLLALLLALWGLAAVAAAPRVTVTSNLSADAKLATARRLPIMLVFTASDCSYCELLEREILRPMLISGDYDDKVIIRKIVIDEQPSIRDFHGRRVAADQLARRYDVRVTPTILFLDARGRELSERIVGINTVEMFGGRVDAAIANSRHVLDGRDATVARHGTPVR
ncbi:MAG: thioredoxin fold domain-containing protein [Gammaproteobacteria bacterium]